MNKFIAFLAMSLCINAAAREMPKFKAEALDRGLIAIKSGNNAFLSWRLFVDDPADIKFSIYQNNSATPVSSCSNLDAAHTNCTVTGGAAASNTYKVVATSGGAKKDSSVSVGGAWQNQYLEIPVEKPTGRLYNATSKTFSSYTDYTIYDGTVADLDGDGQYEVVFFWGPNNMKDNSQDGVTANVFIDAYKLNGTKLWGKGKWIDLGPNIRAGAHYQTFAVFDFDGNGKAEIIIKTADGTKDAQGTQIGSNDVYINSSGYILDGAEYLTVFEGATGKIIDTKPYDPPRHPSKLNPTGSELNSVWGDNYGNRVDRFLSAVAYLDGARPSAVMVRGYYTRTTLAAWDFDGKELKKRWLFDTRGMSAADKTKYEGQGNHNLTIADVDEDGKDEIIFGAMAINSDGTPRFSTETKHGDALHVGKFKLDRPGLQVVRCLESSPFGIQMYDASTGEIIWSVSAGSDTGRALTASIDPDYPGSQVWGSNGLGIYAADGAMLNSAVPSNMSMNMAIWWDGDTGRELFDVVGSNVDGEPVVQKMTASAGTGGNLRNYSRANIFTFSGAATHGGTKKNPVLQADILGDWREEVILRKLDNTALRIYTTITPTVHTGAGAVPSTGIPTLMHDREYRLAAAWQNSGYNQPPHTSFFLGYNMEPLTRPEPASSSSAAASSSSAQSSSSIEQSSSSIEPSSSSIEQSSGSIAASSSSAGENTPIALPGIARSSALTAMQNAVSLQASGNAIVQIFDLKGKAVRSMKFAPGNYVIPLGDLPRGLYIAKASDGSWSQIAKAAVR